ncbi:MAG: hypothetical protein COA59_01705 [Colwellia sp.]|nr:MAG: hypothetical protein COA59_01705 [Colwellia sp.]
MTLRKISLLVSKYMAILLCLITLLLTTPWGSQVTLLLLNNINGVDFDYHSGSLVRDVKLNSFHLQLDTLDITIEGLATALDFSCVLKKKLCLKSVKADYFSLRYLADNKGEPQVSIEKIATKENTTKDDLLQKKLNNPLFIMPFLIEADLIEIKKSYLIINNNEISIDQFITQLSINKSEFNLFQPTAKQLTLILEKDKTKASAKNQQASSSANNIIVQLPKINLPIALIIKQLQLDEIVIATKSDPNDNCQKNCQQWQSSNNRLSGTWANTDVVISQFQTATPFFSISQLTTEAKLTPPYQINSQLVSQFNDVPWWPEVANTTQKISLQGSFEALIFELISQGNLALTSQGKINLVHEDMPFNFTVNAKKIPTPLSLSLYGAYSSLVLKLSGDIKKQTIELSSQVKGYGYNNAQVKIMATHQQNAFSINKFQLSDTDSLSQLDIQGDVTLLPRDISWQLSAKSTGFSLPKINVNNLAELIKNKAQRDWLLTNLPDSITGRLQGNIDSTGSWSDKEGSNKKWSVTLNDTHISGKLNNIDLTLKADIGVNQSGQLQQGNLLVDFNHSKLTLQTATSAFWDINGQLTVNNINHWHHGVNGALTSNFSVTGKKSNPIIHLNSQLTELNWQHLSSRLLQVEASYQPFNDHKIQLTVNNEQSKWIKDSKDFTVDDLSLRVTGNANQHQIKVNWLGDSTGQLALTGHWNDTFTYWKSSIEQSTFTYLNAALQNDNAFSIEFDLAKQESLIDSHCWHGKGLNICLPNQAIIGGSGEVAVKLNIDLSVIDALFLPKDIELISQVDGDIKVKWSTQHPIKAQAHFALSSGYLKVSDDFNEHQLSQWSQGEFALTIDEQKLTNKLWLTGTNNTPLLNISSTVDLLDGSPTGDSPINGQVMLNQFNLQPFQAILTDVVSLQGKLSTDISINGTLNDPAINGDIRVDNGKLKLRQNANTFDNISTIITIKNNQATLDGKFFIEDKAANLQGVMSWQDNLIINIDLTADALPLIFPPQLVMSISPRLNFSLIEKSLTISGDIEVLDGKYNIQKLSQSSVSFSDDVIIVDQDGQAVVKKSSSFDIITNINVNIGKAFEVEGQGLQSHLFGQLHISQKENTPFQLFGKIQSTKGIFQAYGQKLKIEKGEFTFNGPIDNPYFNLRASRKIKAEDIDVGIQITGLADTLDMQLFSSPTMEKPEILSYLVRGRSLDAGTGNSSAAASLLVGFGVTNSFGLFDQIEKIPLISNIAVDTEGAGDKTQATVSGYVGNRIYLKYGIGVYEPINELTVRMFIFNRFWLEIVSGIEQSTDLYYSFDID